MNFLENKLLQNPSMGHVSTCWSIHTLGVHEPVACALKILQATLHGLEEPGPVLRVSIFLHICNTYLLMKLCKRLITTHSEMSELNRNDLDVPAFLVCLTYAVHPVRMEVVCWASAQPYLVACFFMLITLIILSGGNPESLGPYAFRRTCGLLGCALAVFSKSAGITFPCLLIFVGALTKLARQKRILRHPNRTLDFLMLCFDLAAGAGLIVLTAIALQLALHAQTSEKAVPIQLSPTQHLVRAALAIRSHFQTMLHPFRIRNLYGLPLEGLMLSHLQSLVSVISCTAASALGAFVCLRRIRAGRDACATWGAAWCLFGCLILPTLSGQHGYPCLIADRYSYIPVMAFAPVASLELSRLRAKLRLRSSLRLGIFDSCFIMLIVLLGLQSWVTSSRWRTSEALWRHTSGADVTNPLAFANLKRILEEKGTSRNATHRAQ